MLRVNFFKRAKSPWTLSGVAKVFRAAHKLVKINGELEVNVIGDKEMKNLNHHYRGKNSATDVLSFAWDEDKKIKSEFLGQIYICYPQIARQAKEFGVKINEEFVRMLAHGFLHTVGYDHIKKPDAEKMFKIQEKIIKKYFAK